MTRTAFRSTLAAASLASAVLIFSWADKVEAKSGGSRGQQSQSGQSTNSAKTAPQKPDKPTKNNLLSVKSKGGA
jgi:hypothetical protein